MARHVMTQTERMCLHNAARDPHGQSSGDAAVVFRAIR
jgi:hypothetical protein